jgi:hypothetical protein
VEAGSGCDRFRPKLYLSQSGEIFGRWLGRELSVPFASAVLSKHHALPDAMKMAQG